MKYGRDLNSTLITVHDLVICCIPNCHHLVHGEVVKVNAKSVRVKYSDAYGKLRITSRFPDQLIKV